MRIAPLLVAMFVIPCLAAVAVAQTPTGEQVPAPDETAADAPVQADPQDDAASGAAADAESPGPPDVEIAPAPTSAAPATPDPATEAGPRPTAEPQVEAADALRPVTHQDLWTFRRLGTPVPSPDGNWAIVAVTEPSYDEDSTVSDLWLIAVDGGDDPRRLTATPGTEDGVAWSPDGTRIVFSATRGEDEASQLYLLDMTAPGEAVKITSLATGAATPVWSPDGKQIAFESRVFPGATTEAANAEEKKRRDTRPYNVSAYDTFPIRQWDRWRDDLKTHLFVQAARPGATATDLLAGSKLVGSKGFGGVPSLATETLTPQWTPDGNAIVISATVNLDHAAYAETIYHLYRVSLSGGEPESLTRGENWSCHTPQFDPGGDALYCLVDPVSAYAYNLTEVARFDWPSSGQAEDFVSNPDVLTSNFDRSTIEFALGGDGRTLFLTAMDQGKVRLFSVRTRGGEVARLNEESSGAYAGPMAAGRSLVARWESATRPAEIVRINTRSGKHTLLTKFNVERAASLDRRPFDEFWIDTPTGRRVHSFVALPPGLNENARYPVIALIHGGPHASSLDADHVRWSPHVLAAPGYVVVMTDYTGSVGYGVDFSQAIQQDPLRTPGDEIVAALDEAIRLYPFIDPDRQAAVGASYGGHLVNWLQGTTSRFRTLVGHAGLVSLEGQWATSDMVYHREINAGGPPWGDSNIWAEQSPASYADNFRTPMLLTIGEKDYRVPVNQTIATWTYLQRRQVPGRLLVFHDANHWIMKGAEARYYWDEVHAWLASYLR